MVVKRTDHVHPAEEPGSEGVASLNRRFAPAQCLFLVTEGRVRRSETERVAIARPRDAGGEDARPVPEAGLRIGLGEDGSPAGQELPPR